MTKPVDWRNKPLAFLLLGLIYLGVNGAIWSSQGIRRGGDTGLFESGSQNLLQGKILEGKQASYAGFIFLLTLTQRLGAGYEGMVVIQILTAGIAALALYDIGCRFYGSIAGFLAGFFFVVNPDIAQWNTYILTDSLYISSVIITTWLIYRASKDGRYWYFGAILAILITASLRPNGWLFVPVAGLYWVVIARSWNSIPWLGILLSLTVLFAVLFVSSGYKGSMQSVQPYQMLTQGEVVWDYEDWRLTMPLGEDKIGNEWITVLRYVIRHPLVSLRLAAYRVGACLAHIRPFYSFRHNILAIVFLVPLYLLAIYGLFLARHKQLTILLVSVIGSHLLLVALTFADWDGRFLLYTLPLIGVFSACGAAKINSRWLDLLLGRGIITSK